MKTQLSMAEVLSIPQNGYKVVSTFSGCGGSSMGYRLSGFKVLGAVEFIPAAIQVYKENFPDTHVFGCDIRELKAEDILKQFDLKVGELDIFDGSPPCASFSIQGSREELWGEEKSYSGTTQRVDDLFFEYARLVKDIQPKVFVAENVEGLTLGNARKVLDIILDTLRACGYVVEYKVLDAKDYAVPQVRRRCIIMGVRKDLFEQYGVYPVYPRGYGYEITTREAIEDLMSEEGDVPMKPETNVYDKWVLEGKFPPECDDSHILKMAEIDGRKYFQSALRRKYWNTPCYTIRAHHDRPYHPKVNRHLSIGEAKRLSTFPDDFKLSLSSGQNWERIGRAVPPNLMKAISGCIRDNILALIDHPLSKHEIEKRKAHFNGCSLGSMFGETAVVNKDVGIDALNEHISNLRTPPKSRSVVKSLEF